MVYQGLPALDISALQNLISKTILKGEVWNEIFCNKDGIWRIEQGIAPEYARWKRVHPWELHNPKAISFVFSLIGVGINSKFMSFISILMC